MIQFEIDPTLVADALAEGRKLIVEVRSPKHIKVTVGDKSPHAQTIAIAKRAA